MGAPLLGPNGRPLLGPNGKPATDPDCCCGAVGQCTVDAACGPVPDRVILDWTLSQDSYTIPTSGNVYDVPTLGIGTSGATELLFFSGDIFGCTWRRSLLTTFTATRTYEGFNNCDDVLNSFTGTIGVIFSLRFSLSTGTWSASITPTGDTGGRISVSPCGTSNAPFTTTAIPGSNLGIDASLGIVTAKFSDNSLQCNSDGFAFKSAGGTYSYTIFGTSEALPCFRRGLNCDLVDYVALGGTLPTFLGATSQITAASVSW